MPRRLALLVATYLYQDAGLRQLTTPAHDVEALAEVLRDPEIAGFDVTVLVNEPHHLVGEAIGEFYGNPRRDDLTLLYFTGHGLKDDQGRLYLAMTNTKRDRLLFTGLSAQQIDDAMESCWSRQKVLVLDCCYSGAFPAGRIAKSDTHVHALEKFQGKGRVVLTASDATQYSFEGNEIIGQGTQSVFTRFLVEGLTTGEADLDGDGDISLDELYSYVYDRVIEEIPQQRPKKQENVEGRIVIARNIHWSLPAYIRNAIESPLARDRLAILEDLAHLHRVGNDIVQAEVINQARRLIHDDSAAVSASAMKLITALSPEQARREVEEQRAQRDAEQRAQREMEEQRWVPAVTPTPPHRRAKERDEGKVVTPPPLPLPADDTTARGDQLEPQAGIDQYTQTRTARRGQIVTASAILITIALIIGITSTFLSQNSKPRSDASGVTTPLSGISDPVTWVGAFCGGLDDVIAGAADLEKAPATPQGQKDALLAFSDRSQRAMAGTAHLLEQVGPPRITDGKRIHDTAVTFFRSAAETITDQRTKIAAVDSNDPEFTQKLSQLPGPDLGASSVQVQ
ncbi:MAG: caspase family protein, partial [Pseudonocardiaceae bacterium]